MKKIMLLILAVLLLTGCNVEYNLTISEDYILENINVSTENELESNELSAYKRPIEAFLESPVSSELNEELSGVEYYELNKYMNNNLQNLSIKYNFKFNEFKNSHIINRSVSLFELEESNGIYGFYTGSNIKALKTYEEINNLTIKITLDNEFELVKSNADSVVNNVYTWNVTRFNYQNKPISLQFKKVGSENNNSNNNNQVDVPIDNNDEISTNDIIIVIVSLLSFVLILILIITIRKKIRK